MREEKKQNAKLLKKQARDAVENAKQERVKHLAAQLAVLKETFSKFFNSLRLVLPKAKPLLRIVGFIVIILALLWAGSWVAPQFLSLTPTAKASVTSRPITTIASSSSPIVFTKTLEPSATPTKLKTPLPTALPPRITDGKDVQMMLVLAGEFTMGSNEGNFDEKPVHVVYLSAFYMDKYEVTISQYKACMEAAVCGSPKGNVVDKYFGDYWAKFPITDVTWYDAVTYCNWRNARLPTESEWEKSARGLDQRTYPWGEDEPEPPYVHTNSGKLIPGNQYANFASGFPAFGDYEKGRSTYGIYNLAGSVWEWIADRYAKGYYSVSEYNNPQGPTNGAMRVLRGGSYHDKDPFVLRTTYRYKLEPTQVKPTIGFRCARDANP